MPYKVDPKTGYIDYDQLENTALLFRPGISCYSRLLDYSRFREIADKCGAYLLADMAHISGLVAANIIPSPFEYADVVTTTTHKSLRGPRLKKITPKGEKVMYDLERKIDSAVFPGLQGGPHNHTIAVSVEAIVETILCYPLLFVLGIAVALQQCLTEDFVKYSEQVLINSQALANRLMELGYTLVTGDQSALRPSGIRLGTPALTTRGMKENDFVRVADFIHEGVEILMKYQSQAGKTMKDFIAFTSSNAQFMADIDKLGEKVEQFTSQFDMPGNDDI
ncbi:glycine hydroxymethyltransferase [Onchocerca flexuosa]|uniref:Glycine hydroxymethyltransferase n=2 Tax=Onchocerca flexuosa TaxID=387005 RepID=A0A238BY52_9BILA|nr:glycine hydroxymethyltransferase [Onchocerca flexuosa]